MLLNDLKKAALCVAAGFAVSMLGGCDSQKSAGAPGGAAAQRAPQVSVTEIQPTELDMTTTLQGRTAPYLVADVRPQVQCQSRAPESAGRAVPDSPDR